MVHLEGHVSITADKYLGQLQDGCKLHFCPADDKSQMLKQA